MVSFSVLWVIDGDSAKGSDSTFNILVPVCFCTCSISKFHNTKHLSFLNRIRDLFHLFQKCPASTQIQIWLIMNCCLHKRVKNDEVIC